VIDLTKEMLTAEVQLFEHAEKVVSRLAAAYPLMLVTKGDLFDQELKIDRSGLRPYFRHVEIVSDKTLDSYAALLARHHIDPARFLMIGNSLRSDVLPVVALGGRAVHIPYHLTWAHEHVSPPAGDRDRYYELEHLGLLPALIERLSEN
jgi:putative hydrolase of the HAD superfamily